MLKGSPSYTEKLTEMLRERLLSKELISVVYYDSPQGVPDANSKGRREDEREAQSWAKSSN